MLSDTNGEIVIIVVGPCFWHMVFVNEVPYSNMFE